MNSILVRQREGLGNGSRGATPSATSRGLPVRELLALTGEGLARIPWLQLTLGLVVALLAGLSPWVIGHGLSALDREFSAIEVRGDLNRLGHASLEEALEPFLGRSYFATDLNRIKSRVEAHPWVESAAVSREWPGTLKVEVIEQRPVAYWNRTALLNPRGQVFAPLNPGTAGPVPDLIGPVGQQRQVLERARAFSEQLVAADLRLAALELEHRGAWILTLDNGIEVSLGRDQVDERFARFLDVYQGHLTDQAEDIQGIDARYSNGIAVRWREPSEGATRGDQT